MATEAANRMSEFCYGCLGRGASYFLVAAVLVGCKAHDPREAPAHSVEAAKHRTQPGASGESSTGADELSRQAAAQPQPATPKQEAESKHGSSPTATEQPSSAASKGPSDASSAASVDQSTRFAGTQFPPIDIEPPFERSAQPGDGKWVPLGDASKHELAAETPRVLYTTTLHPHPVSRFLALHLVAVDLKHADLQLVPGTDDVKPEEQKRLAQAVSPGLVPVDEQNGLLAVMNGGFQRRHGNWGFALAGVELVPQKQQGCTLARLTNGELLMGTWSELDIAPADAAFLRQTPPCLVENGSIHPHLEQKRERTWGGQNPKRKTRRRSALGLDRTGRILYYGVGIELEPSQLAEAMRLGGAQVAAQFDINFYWVRLLLFGRESAGEALRVTTPLLSDMKYQTSGYVRRPATRDFFYLDKRASD